MFVVEDIRPARILRVLHMVELRALRATVSVIFVMQFTELAHMDQARHMVGQYVRVVQEFVTSVIKIMELVIM